MEDAQVEGDEDVNSQLDDTKVGTGFEPCPDETRSPLNGGVDSVDGSTRHLRGPVISSWNVPHPGKSMTPGDPRTMVGPWARGLNRRMDGRPSFSRTWI